jgi:Tfp pilus assembly protein PilX
MKKEIKNVNFNKQSGIAFIMTLLIMTGLLALALGITSLLVRELKLSQEIANSVVAYSAADAGMERFMYGINQESLDLTTCCCEDAGCSGENTKNCYSTSLSNEASYLVCTKKTTPPIEIKSTGTYKGTNRTIQVNF